MVEGERWGDRDFGDVPVCHLLYQELVTAGSLDDFFDELTVLAEIDDDKRLTPIIEESGISGNRGERFVVRYNSPSLNQLVGMLSKTSQNKPILDVLKRVRFGILLAGEYMAKIQRTSTYEEALALYEHAARYFDRCLTIGFFTHWMQRAQSSDQRRDIYGFLYNDDVLPDDGFWETWMALADNLDEKKYILAEMMKDESALYGKFVYEQLPQMRGRDERIAFFEFVSSKGKVGESFYNRWLSLCGGQDELIDVLIAMGRNDICFSASMQKIVSDLAFLQGRNCVTRARRIVRAVESNLGIDSSMVFALRSMFSERAIAA